MKAKEQELIVEALSHLLENYLDSEEILKVEKIERLIQEVRR